MEAVILSKEQFTELKGSIDEIKNKIENQNKKPHEVFIDNQEFLIMMKISKRTAQTWRDEGKISFSQVGNKIYYKLSDVEVLLNQHYVKSFKHNSNFQNGLKDSLTPSEKNNQVGKSFKK
jgi:hypothetical protein